MSFDELNKTDLGYNGFTDFEAGAQSRQAEIDELKKMIEEAMEILEYNEYVDSPLQALDILKGQKND